MKNLVIYRACDRPKYMAGSAACFRYELYAHYPMKDGSIFTFNQWSKQFRCGWFCRYRFRKEKIDSRDDYPEYYDHIQAQKHPKRAM